jgi:hypothetical protein
MKARSLFLLKQMPTPRRLAAISEGLDFLVEHVETLERDLGALWQDDGRRGARILDAQADEEAAKAMMLLDLVRINPAAEEAFDRQIRHFYNHLARCIYVEMAEMRPAAFSEVKSLVGLFRPSLYLDGPNDVDWIFRNELLARREEGLYVDLIQEEGGERWVSPAQFDDIRLIGEPRSSIRELVGSLHRLGAMSPAGLLVIQEIWQEMEVTDATHWREIQAANETTVMRLLGDDLALESASDDDAARVSSFWPFPLGDLDLRESKVSAAALKEERERRSFGE